MTTTPDSMPHADAPAFETTFDALPANARVWVLASNRPLQGEDKDAVIHAVEKGYKTWRMKAPAARGCHAVRDEYFLVIGADESAEMLSGCSIDALMSWVLRLEQETGLKLVDRMAVYYRDTGGDVQLTNRLGFKKLLKDGAVNGDTQVFDTTISRIESLRENRFEIPLRESWLAQLFPTA